MATAIANSNIAFIKYWGNVDNDLRIPANGSISMNLGGLETRTTVRFSPELAADSFSLNGSPVEGAGFTRVMAFLDHIRSLAGITACADVVSSNNFPTGAGIASSASAFAALALAGAAAAGLNLPEPDLSRLARRGSGSACRSIPGGFVEWLPGNEDADSYAHTIAPADHWDLVDCVAIVSLKHKPTGSTEGHRLTTTSPLQSARVADTPRRLDICRRAILECDFEALTDVVEQDSTLMHAVMMTSQPPLFYWEPGTLQVIHAVHSWRQAGIPVTYSIDAGPNVHVLCPAAYHDEVRSKLSDLENVKDVLVATPGGPAHLVGTSPD